MTTKRPASLLTCSTCGHPIPKGQTKTLPFCSERCRTIDMGRWLGEEIGVPHEGGPGGGVTDPRLDQTRDAPEDSPETIEFD